VLGWVTDLGASGALGVLLGGLLIIAAVLVFPPGRAWQRDRNLRDEQTHTFTAASVNRKSVGMSSETDWLSWQKLMEFPSAYVLVPITRVGIRPIPKRAFASPEDEAAFLHLVNRHIGKS
jgi:hypothetical protein